MIYHKDSLPSEFREVVFIITLEEKNGWLLPFRAQREIFFPIHHTVLSFRTLERKLEFRVISTRKMKPKFFSF